MRAGDVHGLDPRGPAGPRRGSGRPPPPRRPSDPTDVHVMSEKSCVYDTANAACAAALCASEPMNASISTPPMFIAMPWMPVGRPNRNSERMIVQSGPKPPSARESRRPSRRATASTARRARPAPDAMHGSHRRARRAERGNRAEPADEDDVEHEVQHRHGDAEDHRRARVAGRAQRAAEHEEHHHAAAEHEHDAQETAAPRPSPSGAAFTRSSSHGDDEVADRRHDADRDADRRQERLVDRAVDLVLVAGAGEARDEHAHPGEQRRDEDDDDEEDLPAHADRGVAR